MFSILYNQLLTISNYFFRFLGATLATDVVDPLSSMGGIGVGGGGGGGGVGGGIGVSGVGGVGVANISNPSAHVRSPLYATQSLPETVSYRKKLNQFMPYEFNIVLRLIFNYFIFP